MPIEHAGDAPLAHAGASTSATDAVRLDLERPDDVHVGADARAPSAEPAVVADGAATLVTVRDRKTKLPIAHAEIARPSARAVLAFTDASGVARVASSALADRAPSQAPFGRAPTIEFLVVRAKGYTESRIVEAANAEPRASYDVELDAARVVRGRVVDAEHAPVADADVRLEVAVVEGDGADDGNLRDLTLRRGGFSSYRDARSAADGTFRIEDVALHALLVARAVHPTKGAGVREASGLDVEALDVDVGDVELGPLRRLEGRVVTRYPDEVASDPVEGAVVRCLSFDAIGFPTRRRMDEATRTVTTGADGRFAFESLVPARYDVTTGDSSRKTVNGLPMSPNGPTAGVDLVQLTEATGIELVIPRTKSLTGIVVDANSAPLRGARLTARNANVYGTAITDADGRFEVKELGVKPVELEVVPSGLSRGVLRTVVAGLVPGDRDVRVQMQSSATIAGSVLTPSGEPLAFAGVTALDANGREAGFTYADASGRFELSVREGERFDLVAQPSRMKTESVRTLDKESDVRGRTASVRAGTVDVVLRAQRSN